MSGGSFPPNSNKIIKSRMPGNPADSKKDIHPFPFLLPWVRILYPGKIWTAPKNDFFMGV
jgi:hypothetical protein